MTKFLFRPVITAFILCFISSLVHAQTPLKPGMFWRISGNGLSKPSYLLGTMHLKDKRIFNFPDSLYAAIEQTEGMAIEMTPSAMDTAKAALENENLLLKSLLSPEQFKRISKKLDTTFKKKAEKVTFSEFEDYCRLRVINLEQDNNMASIMDTYLNAIASRKGKWTGAVEERQDKDRSDPKKEAVSYIDGFMKTDTELRAVIENMVTIYVNNDLNSLMKVYGNIESDKQMVIRNQNMVRRMDSLLQIRSMFFAVGAAHLGQEPGLVALLRKKGYKVEPVLFSKRIPMEQHLFSQAAFSDSWITVKGLDSLYSIRMPATPSGLTEKPDSEMLMFADDLTGIAYLSVLTPKVPGMGVEMVAEGTMRSMKAEVRSTKKITKQGIPGIEMTAFNPSDRTIVIMQMFTVNWRCYAAGIGYPEKMEMPEAKLKEYFDGYNIHATPDEPSAIAAVPVEITDPASGLSVWFPSKPSQDSISQNEMAYTRKILASDDESQSMFLCMIENLKKDYFRTSNQEKFNAYIENLQSNPDIRIDTTERREWNGYPALWVKYVLQISQDSAFCTTLNVLKGNRAFYFMTMSFYKEGKKELVNKYYNSIKFSTGADKPWGSYALPDATASVWAPEPFTVYHDSTGATQKFLVRMLAYDSTSSGTIELKKAVLNQYFWAQSDTAELRKYAMDNVTATDSLLSFNMRKQGPFDAVEISARSFQTLNTKRLLLMLHKDSLVSVYATGDSNTVFNGNYNKLFASYQPADKFIPANLDKRKPELLFEALKSTDSITLGMAMHAMRIVDFKTEQLPLLHKALSYPYIDSLNEGQVPILICNGILSVKDPSSLKALETAYMQLIPKNDIARGVILNTLVAWKTDSAYQLISKLANASFPYGTNYYFMGDYCDSTELAAAHVSELLPLLKDTASAGLVLRIVNSLVEDGTMKVAVLAPYKKYIYAFANHIALKEAEEDMNTYFNLRHTSTILGNLKDPGAVPVLRKLLLNKSINVKMMAVKALLPLGQPVAASDLLKLATHKSYRLQLYDTLASLKKLAVFPKKYLNQKAIAESELFDLGSDDYSPDTLVYIGERIANYKNAKKKFLVYKLVYKGDDETWTQLGIAGPYSLTAGASIKRDAEANGIIYNKEFNAATITDDLKEWLESLEKNEKE